MTNLKSLWRSSTVARVFIFSFAIIHIPLLALVAFLAAGGELHMMSVVIVAVLATVLASLLSLWTIWKLIQPIDDLGRALEKYRRNGVYPEIRPQGSYRLRRLARDIEQMVQAQEGTIRVLRTQANTDALTGMGNRRWLAQTTDGMIRRARASGQMIWVVLFDIDRFKDINDTYGHAVGDRVLEAVSDIARLQIRPYDAIARIGGEEFCLVLSHRDSGPAIAAAERMRVALAAWRPQDLPVEQVTASFGVAGGSPHKVDLETLLKQADDALYAAKRGGRNVTVTAAELG